MLKILRKQLGVFIGEKSYEIPYAGAKILSIFETQGIPIKFDCRKGTCKTCAVTVTYQGETMETLACMEDAVEGMQIALPLEAPTLVIPPMETKRVTTRKVKIQVSAASRLNAKVMRLLNQAQDAVLEGLWEDACDYAEEILDISKSLENPEEVQQVFFTGQNRDLLQGFIVSLSSSYLSRCRLLSQKMKETIFYFFLVSDDLERSNQARSWRYRP